MPLHFPVLGHTLLAADPRRLASFVAGYRALTSAIQSENGVAEAHASLLSALCRWDIEDHERSIQEVSVPPDESAIRARLSKMLPYAEMLEDEHRDGAVRTLTKCVDALEPMPGGNIRFVRMCLRRVERCEAMDAPAALMITDARLIANALESWKAAPRPYPSGFGSEHEFEGLLFAGINACIDGAPEAVRRRDLGLGVSNVVESALGLSPSEMDALLDAETGRDAPALECAQEALGRYPLVPAERVHALGCSFRGTQDYLEASGPIGWADHAGALELAEGLRDLGARTAKAQEALEAAADRIEEVAREGLSIVGCLEFLVYESDGQRTYFVRDYSFEDHPF